MNFYTHQSRSPWAIIEQPRTTDRPSIQPVTITNATTGLTLTGEIHLTGATLGATGPAVAEFTGTGHNTGATAAGYITTR